MWRGGVSRRATCFFRGVNWGESVVNKKNVDTSTRSHARKSAPLTLNQRKEKQQLFLELYRQCANIKASCEAAGIDRTTFYNWKNDDSVFAAQVAEAENDANDTAERALYDRAVLGVEEYVVSNRQVVYHQGQPLTHRVYSDRLLEVLLKARMPDKYKEKQQIEHKIETQDLSKLSNEDLVLAEQLARKASEDGQIS